jgi:hypothetical protein
MIRAWVFPIIPNYEGASRLKSSYCWAEPRRLVEPLVPTPKINPLPVQSMQVVFLAYVVGRISQNKPKKVSYNYHKINFKHYGHNLILMVQEAIKMEDEAQKHDTIVHIGKLMKSYHMTWSKEIIDDEVLVKNIGIMSEGLLTIDINKVKEDGLFEPLYKERINTSINSNTNTRYKKNNNNGHKNQNQNRKRRN